MPLTFPSHAAAILPLLCLPGVRRRPPSALVIGSTAPELTYLVGTHGADSHQPWGLLRFCLPAALVAFVLLEGVLLPALAPLGVALLPARWRSTLWEAGWSGVAWSALLLAAGCLLLQLRSSPPRRD